MVHSAGSQEVQFQPNIPQDQTGQQPASAVPGKVHDVFGEMFEKCIISIQGDDDSFEELEFTHEPPVTAVPNPGRERVHEASLEAVPIHEAGHKLASDAPKSVRMELQELHRDLDPKELTLPTLPAHTGRFGKLKQRFADWVMAKKLDRAGDVGSAQFQHRVDQLVGSSNGNPARLIALGKALEKKMAESSSSNPTLEAKASLLHMGSKVQWSNLGHVKGLSPDIQLNHNERAALVRQIASQPTGSTPSENFKNVQNGEIASLAREALDKRDKFWTTDAGKSLEQAARKERKEQDDALCKELNDLDDKRRLGAKEGRTELGFNPEKGGFYYASKVSRADSVAARSHLLKLVNTIASHGLSLRSVGEVGSTMQDVAKDILSSDWARENLGKEALKALRPLVLAGFSIDNAGRMAKYNFVEALRPAMEKILEGKPQENRFVEGWNIYCANAAKVANLQPQMDQILASLKNATTVDELIELSNFFTKSGKRTAYSEFDRQIRPLMNALAEENDPKKMIPKACKEYADQFLKGNQTGEPYQKDAVHKMIDDYVAKEDWQGLNEYMLAFVKYAEETFVDL